MSASDAPKSSRRERKREQTASHIAATAFRLFEAQGYDAVAMEQIAAEADVAKATLYNYFPVKEALLAQQFREEIAAGMSGSAAALAQQPDFRSRMQGLLRASAHWNTSRRRYLPQYLRFRMTEIGAPPDALPASRHSGVHRILESLFRSAQEQGEVRTDVAAVELAWMFEFLCMGAVMVWLRLPDDDLERRFLQALDVLLDGAAVPATAGKATASKAATSKATAGKAATSKATAGKATAGKAAASRVKADKTKADKAKKSR